MSVQNQKKVFAVTVLVGVAGLSFFSGCDWLPFGKKDNSEVLLKINGKPAMTAAEYEEQLDMARKSNQQIDMLLQMMPNAEKEYIFKGLSIGKLMKAWAEKEGIDKTAEFKKQQKQIHEAMDLQLYMKAFEESHPFNASDEDVEAFYEAQKDTIPGFAISKDGVNVAYVRFDSQSKADAFLAKVKEHKDLKKFESEAHAENVSVSKETINEKDSFSDAIKKAVLDIKSFPRIVLVKVPARSDIKGAGDSYWVLFASGRSEAKYHDIKSPQVKQGLKKMMADQSKEKNLEQFIESLRKDLKVEENLEYFVKKEEQKRAAMEAKDQAVDGKEDDSVDQQEDESENVSVPAEKL